MLRAITNMKSQHESKTTPDRQVPSRHFNHHEDGFSLVELMVGMTVGLIAILAVLQTLSFYENQKRTTVSGADAQQSGLMSLFAIEQQVHNAGNGYASNDTYSCQNVFWYFDPDGSTGARGAIGSTGSNTPNVAGSLDISPIRLNNNLTGTRPFADAIDVNSASRFIGSTPTRLTRRMDATNRTLSVERIFDFNVNDVILVVRPDRLNCALMRVSAVDLNTFTLTTNYAAGNTPEYNPPTADLTTSNWPGYGIRASDAQAFVEKSLVFRIGDINNGGITTQRFCIHHPANTNTFELRIDPSANCATTPCTAANQCFTLANDVVNLQVQYGFSSANNIRTVTLWRNPDHADVTSLTDEQLRKRVKSVRIAVIVRSSKREGGIVTPICSATTAAGPCSCQNAANNFGPCLWRDTAADQAPAVDLRLGNGDTEWQHYRYKVFETVIPLRNSVWPDFL